jgi:hypothetical protein
MTPLKLTARKTVGGSAKRVAVDTSAVISRSPSTASDVEIVEIIDIEMTDNIDPRIPGASKAPPPAVANPTRAAPEDTNVDVTDDVSDYQCRSLQPLLSDIPDSGATFAPMEAIPSRSVTIVGPRPATGAFRASAL